MGVVLRVLVCKNRKRRRLKQYSIITVLMIWSYRFLIFASLLTLIIGVVLSVPRGDPKRSPHTFS